SVSGVSAVSAFLTPAACSCSMSSAGGNPSSLANCVTLICAIYLFLSVSFSKPRGAGSHDQLLHALRIEGREFYQIISAKISEFLLGTDALGSQQARGFAVHAFDLHQILDVMLHFLFAHDRLREQCIART